MIYDEGFARRLQLSQRGYRFCHNRSARKHRRQGHHVMWAGEGWYAWKPRDGATQEHSPMQINKALLMLAMGIALAACREPDKAEPEPTDSPKDDAEAADQAPTEGR